MKTIEWLMLSVLVLPSAVPAVAQQPATSQQAEQARARFEQIRERLALTPDQAEQVRPVMTEEIQQLKTLREKYSGDQSRRSRMKMAREARGIRDSADQKLKKILSRKQMDELQALRSEWSDELRERKKG